MTILRIIFNRTRDISRLTCIVCVTEAWQNMWSVLSINCKCTCHCCL